MASEGEGLVRRRSTPVGVVTALYNPSRHPVRSGLLVGVVPVALGAGVIEAVHVVGASPVGAALAGSGEVATSAALATGLGSLCVSLAARDSMRSTRSSGTKLRISKDARGLFRGVSVTSVAVATGSALVGGFLEATGHAPGAAFRITEAAGIVSTGGLSGARYWGKRVREQVLAGS